MWNIFEELSEFVTFFILESMKILYQESMEF